MANAKAGGWRHAGRRLVILGLGVAMLLSTPLPSIAHSRLVKSNPAAGEKVAASPVIVTTWFSHELDTRKSRITIIGPQGRSTDGRVDLYDPDHASMVVRLGASLPAGRYTVRWRAISADDGDVTKGQFEFVILKGGDPS